MIEKSTFVVLVFSTVSTSESKSDQKRLILIDGEAGAMSVEFQFPTDDSKKMSDVGQLKWNETKENYFAVQRSETHFSFNLDIRIFVWGFLKSRGI